jgi:dynein light chain Tctex-type 1
MVIRTVQVAHTAFNWVNACFQLPTMGSESDDLAFIQEDINALAKEVFFLFSFQSIESILKAQEFKASTVNSRCTAIVDDVTKKLSALNKPFKYVTSCVIMQKNGAGLHLAVSLLWDQTTDGSVTVRWENATMHVILSVYGVML